MIPDINKLSLHTPYTGLAKIAIENGQMLVVQNAGTSMINTPLYNFNL